MEYILIIINFFAYYFDFLIQNIEIEINKINSYKNRYDE